MNWFSTFLTSSIGRKLLMSLTGLFLITFLPVHLIGNLQLMYADGGEAFNVYAEFMTGNPLVKFISYGLYFFILLHAVQGIMMWRKNAGARTSRYAVKNNSTTTFSSRNMGWLGVIVLVFILIHMYQFWLQMKLDVVPMTTVGGAEVKDLYGIVSQTYENLGFVIFYVISMVVIALHLWHGFQSAFQTLGLNHKKYTPAIRVLGMIYSVLIPLGFAIIPIYMYLN